MSDDDHSRDEGTALSEDGRVQLIHRPLPDRAHRIADDLAGIAHELREGNAGTSDQRLRLAAAIVSMRMLADDLREQLAAANDTTPSTAAAWEVDAYATRYTAYSTGAADEAPGWLPVDAMHTVVAELAAANKRAQAAEAEVDTYRAQLAQWADIKQAIGDVRKMRERAARTEQAEAERNEAKARLAERDEERVLMYRIIGVIEHAYALNTYVELEPGETAPTVESLWAKVRELRGMAPDAAADGHSATQTGCDRHGETTTTPDGTGTGTTHA